MRTAGMSLRPYLCQRRAVLKLSLQYDMGPRIHDSLNQRRSGSTKIDPTILPTTDKKQIRDLHHPRFDSPHLLSSPLQQALINQTHILVFIKVLINTPQCHLLRKQQNQGMGQITTRRIQKSITLALKAIAITSLRAKIRADIGEMASLIETHGQITSHPSNIENKEEVLVLGEEGTTGAMATVTQEKARLVSLRLQTQPSGVSILVARISLPLLISYNSTITSEQDTSVQRRIVYFPA